MKNKNGVSVSDSDKIGNHCIIENAQCYCGRKLIIAPKAYQEKDGLVAMCEDFGHARWYFDDLTEGKQSK